MTRREVLLAIATLPIGALWCEAAAGTTRSAPGCPDAPEALLGRTYVEQHPDETEVLLKKALQWSRGGFPMAALQKMHVADFLDRRVVKVGGWILSRTEARLAALLFLLSRGS